MAHGEPITEMLNRAAHGDRDAADRVMEILYDELRSIARAQLRHSPVRVSVPPTELVHEAYLRLAGRDADWESRGHFLCLCARVMRGALVDHMRRRNAQRRGGGRRAAPLDAAARWFEERNIDLLALDEALDRLAALDERKRALVELRFFAGLGNDDAARALGISRATVERDWALARAWLFREMAE